MLTTYLISYLCFTTRILVIDKLILLNYIFLNYCQITLLTKLVQSVTYGVSSILLSLGFLQIISFLGHTESPPALTDALVDLRLWNIGSFLLQNLVNIEIVEQIG